MPVQYYCTKIIQMLSNDWAWQSFIYYSSGIKQYRAYHCKIKTLLGSSGFKAFSVYIYKDKETISIKHFM